MQNFERATPEPEHPKGTIVRYPRTNADRDIEDLEAFQSFLDDPNIVGLAHHEPRAPLVDYGNSREPVIEYPKTDADVKFLREFDDTEHLWEPHFKKH
jgi:hypothetical protein